MNTDFIINTILLTLLTLPSVLSTQPTCSSEKRERVQMYLERTMEDINEVLLISLTNFNHNFSLLSTLFLRKVLLMSMLLIAKVLANTITLMDMTKYPF